MTLDDAEKIVDGSMDPEDVWRGALFPISTGSTDLERPHHSTTEWVA